MKLIRVNNKELNENCTLNEAGLSRMLNHVKDKNSFAVIGSQDKDTKEDRFLELLSEINKLRRANKQPVGFNRLEGTYTYDNGETGFEDSLIIYNISKEDAIKIGKKLNQESIIWKEPNFFGFVYMDGRPDENDFKGGLSFDREAALAYGSKLRGKHNNAKPFVFEANLIETTNRGSNFSRQGRATIEKSQLFKVKVK